jgi:methyl-accepting chemotaxis protein
MKGIKLKTLAIGISGSIGMAILVIFTIICTSVLKSQNPDMANTKAITALVIGSIVIAVIIITVLLIIAAMMGKRIVTPVNMLTQFIKVVTYDGQVQFPPDSWVLARQMASAKDETGEAFASLNDMVLRFERIGLLLQKIADGDFTAEAKTLGKLDLIGNSIIKVLIDLNRSLGEIGGVTREVKSGADQISGISQNLAQGSSEQAATVEELSSSIDEISVKTKENADLARDAANLSDTVMQNAEKGSDQMNSLTAAVQDIDEASKNISKIIKVIDDIAFQTNILALNAAVEAARAGEAGKGFAVVADEVRNLASKSAAAAKETGTLIENSMKKAELGSDIAKETAFSLGEMVAGITKTTGIINEIADGLEIQNSSLLQIGKAVNEVSDVVSRNASTAEEAAAASEELDSQSAILAQNVGLFKVR